MNTCLDLACGSAGVLLSLDSDLSRVGIAYAAAIIAGVFSRLVLMSDVHPHAIQRSTLRRHLGHPVEPPSSATSHATDATVDR